MPARQDLSVSIPSSATPPQDITSYTRFMHEHTRKLLEASSPTAPPQSSARSGSSVCSVSSRDSRA